MSSWDDRPAEEGNLLNPSFCTLVLLHAVEDYSRTMPAGMPLSLAFLILPIVLHRPTREALPRRTSKALSSWLEEHEALRVTFAERAKALVPFVREAVLFGCAHGVLKFGEEGRLLVGVKPRGTSRYASAVTEEVRECLSRAQFVGRWIATAGTVPTVFALWGVRP